MSNLSNTIFRQNAIDSLNAIDDIPEALQIIDPTNFAWMFAAFLALMSIISWCWFGKISLTVETQGIVITKSQLEEIERNNRNTIIYQKENTSELYDLYIKKYELYRKHYVTRTELKQSKDDYEAAKENLIDLEKNIHITATQSNGKNGEFPLQILAFIDHKQAKKVRPGMRVRISSSINSEFSNNYSTGIVSSISTFPITKQLAYTYLRNNSLVDAYFQQGTPFLMKIDFLSNSQNKRLDLQPGETIYGKVKYKTCTPFQLLSKK